MHSCPHFASKVGINVFCLLHFVFIMLIVFKWLLVNDPQGGILEHFLH